MEMLNVLIAPAAIQTVEVIIILEVMCKALSADQQQTTVLGRALVLQTQPLWLNGTVTMKAENITGTQRRIIVLMVVRMVLVRVTVAVVIM